MEKRAGKFDFEPNSTKLLYLWHSLITGSGLPM